MASPWPMALWGQCGRCRSWFALPAPGLRTARWQCPRCGQDPDRVENRAHPAFARSDHTVAGVAPSDYWIG